MRTVPWVPTGMKHGVVTVPWGRMSRPARAASELASRVKKKIGDLIRRYLVDPLPCCRFVFPG